MADTHGLDVQRVRIMQYLVLLKQIFACQDRTMGSCKIKEKSLEKCWPFGDLRASYAYVGKWL
jgi:hypothetical protein